MGLGCLEDDSKNSRCRQPRLGPCALWDPAARVNLRNMYSDTNPEAALIQRDIFRRMTTEQRLRLALEMSESMRNVALAGLRSRRPELNERELFRELMRVMYGFVPQS